MAFSMISLKVDWNNDGMTVPHTDICSSSIGGFQPTTTGLILSETCPLFLPVEPCEMIMFTS